MKIEQPLAQACWLVERKSFGRPEWWAGCGDWTTQAHDAVRFCRRFDAERVMLSLLIGYLGLAVTEHLFIRADALEVSR